MYILVRVLVLLLDAPVARALFYPSFCGSCHVIPLIGSDSLRTQPSSEGSAGRFLCKELTIHLFKWLGPGFRRDP
jgi:hypothetical protein